MKITKVDPILVALPYEDGAPKRASTPGHSADNVLALFVRVDTDEGVTGWGEAFSFATVPVTIPAIADAVGPLAIGQDPTDIEAVAEAVVPGKELPRQVGHDDGGRACSGNRGVPGSGCCACELHELV